MNRLEIARPALEPAARDAGGRRRPTDPAAVERDCSAAEADFMRAMEEYKRSSGRKFPTWSEALEVARGLGYRQGSL